MLRKISVMVCGLTALIMLAACSGVESKENTGAAGVSTENTEESQTSAPTETPVATPTETSTETPAPAPHDHSYTSAVTKEATCSQVGIKTYSCIFCGREFEREELPKLAHTESDWIVVQEVVGDKNGLQHKVCTICGEELATEEIYPEIVASGVLAEGKIEWKIIGTTLYVSGTGAIPDFEYSASQSRIFPDVLPWDGLVGWQIYDELVEKIVIEEGITKVGRSNFDSFKNVKEIIFADSVTEIGNYACNGLAIETINFNNISKLGTQSFGELKNLKILTIPGNINTISKCCFTGCPNLSEIYIEEGVAAIKERAFEQYGIINCVIHLPASLKSMVDSSLSTGMTVYVKAGSYAEQAANEYKDNSALTIIVE